MEHPDFTRKFRAILEPHARRELYALCGIAVIAGLMETLAVASIMPFLAVLAAPDMLATSPATAKVLELLGASAGADGLLYMGMIVLAILVTSNGFSAMTTWMMLRFANRQGQALGVRLLQTYLGQPYTFYLDRHSAELQKNITAEAYRVTVGALVPGVQIVAKGSVVAFVFTLLVIADPTLALVVAAALAGSYLVIYRFVRTALKAAGQEALESGTLRARHALEAFGAIKDIKLSGREPALVRRYQIPAQRWADAQAMGQALGQIPRYAVESVAFGLILLIAVFLLRRGEGAGAILPLLGLYAFAGYRLMPALQHVFAGWVMMRHSGPALDLVVADLDLRRNAIPAVNAPQSSSALPLRSRIELAGIALTYPGAAAPALTNVNLCIAKNSAIALVGATGCGKTTLVDVLMGLLKPDGGTLRIDQTEIGPHNVRSWQRNIGHVPQQIFIFDDSVGRNIAFGLPDESIDWSKVERAARLARLHDFVVSQLPEGYHTVVGERGIRLSGGQRQRIGIARALYHDPEVLVFDEATSALDNITENALLDSLQELSGRKTIIMVAHRITTVRHCDRVYVMERGQIVEAGSYDELVAREGHFHALATSGT